MKIINANNISDVIQRTLNRVDPRLMDHGKRVAYIVSKMLDMDGGVTHEHRQALCMLALLHDIGAYKTEEIDRMVQFETRNIWNHSAYGYLFIRYLSPLKEYAATVLLHHIDYRMLAMIDAPCKKEAQLVNIADRVDVFLETSYSQPRCLEGYLKERCGTQFDPEAVELYLRADGRYHFRERMEREVDFHRLLGDLELTPKDVDTYLRMLIFAIDFRSRHTVTHTITTTNISEQLSALMGLDGEQRQKVHYGAMLHDLGKIGIPVEILEYPGRLSPQAMQVMRTHVKLTEEILGGCVDEQTARIALRHHEKLDGSGYPRGIHGVGLTKSERIVAVADIVSALCGTRSYKEAFPKQKTLGILHEMSDAGQIDAEVVRVLTTHFDEIMRQVAERCDPVLALHQRIFSEYEELQKRYAQWHERVSSTTA